MAVSSATCVWDIDGKKSTCDWAILQMRSARLAVSELLKSRVATVPSLEQLNSVPWRGINNFRFSCGYWFYRRVIRRNTHVVLESKASFLPLLANHRHGGVRQQTDTL